MRGPFCLTICLRVGPHFVAQRQGALALIHRPRELHELDHSGSAPIHQFSGADDPSPFKFSDKLEEPPLTRDSGEFGRPRHVERLGRP
jgi:hypothetical protein